MSRDPIYAAIENAREIYSGEEAPDVSGVKPGGGSAAPSKPFNYVPTPFVWRDPSRIPRRRFIYGRHLICGVVSATVAPSGVGKSSLVLVEAVAMTAGRDLLGDKPSKALRVWYCNLEDDREEIERRVAAICLHFGITSKDLGDGLYIDGRDTVEIVIATQTKDGVLMAKPVIKGLTTALAAGKFDVLVLDPFVSAHRVSENDNMAIDAIVKALARVAGEAEIAIEAVHHVRKTGGAEITAEDARGAGAMVAAARSVRVLNRMDEEQAKKLAIEDKIRRRIFRMGDDKQNLAPAGETRWFYLHSVPLGNGGGRDADDQDYVAVVDRWKLPDPFEGVTVATLRAVQTKIAAGRWRDSPQAKAWAGRAVAEVLNLDPGNKAHRAKIAALLKAWTNSGALVKVDGKDENHETRTFIEVGIPAND